MEGHSGSLLFYVRYLIEQFEPGILLLPLTLFTFFSGNARRCSIATLCVVCAGIIFLLLTISQTKIFWYAAPILPFLAIAAALGVTDTLHYLKAREPHVPKLFRARSLQVTVVSLLIIVGAASLYRNQVIEPRIADHDGQLWYAALFDKLRANGNSSVIVVDSGLSGNYDPLLKFYAEIAGIEGLKVNMPAFDTIPADVVIHDGAFEGVRDYNPYVKVASGVRVDMIPSLPASQLVATCDPKLVPWLSHLAGLCMRAGGCSASR
jgi:hypothetical protein